MQTPCCPSCSKRANATGILAIVGLLIGFGLIVSGSILVARSPHLHAAHDKKGGYIGMIVVGCLVFLFGLVMLGVTLAADLTAGFFGSWVKAETCTKDQPCC